MPANRHIDIGTFFIAGINYRKTDADLRGQFAINNIQYAKLIELAPQFGVHEFFVLSTCNRTEIYGFSEKASNLCQLLCSHWILLARCLTSKKENLLSSIYLMLHPD